MNVSARYFLCVSWLMVLSVRLPAQNSTPSYEETRGWILEKVRQSAGVREFTEGDEYFSLNYSNVSMDDCKLHYTITAFVQYSKKPSRKHVEKVISELTINLSRVSAQTERYPFTTILFTTKEKGVHLHQVQSGPGVNETADEDLGATNGLGYASTITALLLDQPGIDSDDLANRLLKAFNHTVEICRAKNPPPKEPF
jgi:hypothetical protein